jgi:site-specific DNA-cytosine methylase
MGWWEAEPVSEFFNLLCEAVAAKSRHRDVAVLLSGGLDSLSVALALQKLGKNIHAYTFEVEGYPSRDLAKAEAIARHFGWPITIIAVPTVCVADDFVRLAVQHRCQKKTHYEVLFPILQIFPAIKASEIFTGWNADDHYGNTRKRNVRYARMARDEVPHAERKAAFDEERRRLFTELRNLSSNHNFSLAHRHAARLGKALIDPYLDEAVGDYFLRFDHAELSPPRKPVVRKALAHELAGMPNGSITVGVRLQTGGGVNTLFETLLHDPRINRFERPYERVMDVCQRWAKEVSGDPEAFENELASLPPPPQARTRTMIDKTKIVQAMLAKGATVQEVAQTLGMKVREVALFVMKPAPAVPQSTPKPPTADHGAYRPLMADVHKASAVRRFTVVSLFAGGGGSSIGYRLAGGHVALVSEFVAEAARTYRTNFPDTLVDPRDIRDITATPDGPSRFIAAAGLLPGDLDVLDGSPPCSEFSVAGNGIGDQTVMKAYSDTKQCGIAGLIFEFMAVATGVRPKIVIAENVPTLAGKYADIMDRALERLRFPDGTSGPRAYYAHHTVLSADDFGVPQNRRRLFIVAVRSDVAQAVSITEDRGVAMAFPEPTDPGCTVRQALAGIRQTDHDVRPFRQAAIGTPLGHLIKLFPKDPPGRLGMSDVDPDTKHFKLKRAAWDAPSFTLTCTGQQPDTPSGVVHPAEARKFTLPELKRLTGLPDDYVCTGTLSQAVERVCRMVPPPLTRAIAGRIYDRILRPYAEART